MHRSILSFAPYIFAPPVFYIQPKKKKTTGGIQNVTKTKKKFFTFFHFPIDVELVA